MLSRALWKMAPLDQETTVQICYDGLVLKYAYGLPAFSFLVAVQ